MALYVAGWTGPGAAWTVVLVVIATALGLAFMRGRGDTIYTLVLIWALVGVAVRNWGIPSVAYTAMIAAAVLALVIFTRGGRRPQLAPQMRA